MGAPGIYSGSLLATWQAPKLVAMMRVAAMEVIVARRTACRTTGMVESR